MLASTDDDGNSAPTCLSRDSLTARAAFGPSLSRALRPLVVAALCALVAACAAPAPKVRPPLPTAGWQAAIGKLEVSGTHEVCTAVLVRPDVIATAAHCLTPNGFTASASQILFTSSVTGASARGTALIGQGAESKQGRTDIGNAKTDWALIRIAPLANIPPIPVAAISAAAARVEVAQGAQFYSAGYGEGAKTRLNAHRSCGLAPPDPTSLIEGDLYFSTTCIVRLGDSGGPVALLNGGQPKLIGLNVGFGRQPKTDNSIGIVVSARAFGPFIDGALISFLDLDPGRPSRENIQ